MASVNSSNNSRHCRSNNSNSYSYSQTQNWGDAYCGCGEKAPLRTSKTSANPGRRFLGCVNYEEKNACNFFIWVDPATCPRGLKYGRKLQNKIKDLQEKEEDLKRLNEIAEMDKEKMMKNIDKLWRMNHELKKKNEMMWKCNVLCMIVIGLLLVVFLAIWKPTSGRIS